MYSCQVCQKPGENFDFGNYCDSHRPDGALPTEKPKTIRLYESGETAPRYETFAPDGYRFKSGEHSLLSWSKKEAEQHEKLAVELCPKNCDCK